MRWFFSWCRRLIHMTCRIGRDSENIIYHDTDFEWVIRSSRTIILFSSSDAAWDEVIASCCFKSIMVVISPRRSIIPLIYVGLFGSLVILVYSTTSFTSKGQSQNVPVQGEIPQPEMTPPHPLHQFFQSFYEEIIHLNQKREKTQYPELCRPWITVRTCK